MGTMTTPNRPAPRQGIPAWVPVVGLLVVAGLLVLFAESRKREAKTGSVAEVVQAVKQSVSPCRSATAWQPLDAVLVRWKDAVTLAGSTPRMSLPDQIARLQALRQETIALQMPECAAPSMKALLEHQDNTIESFLLFLRQSETTSAEKSEAASKALEAFVAERKRASL